MKRKNGTNRTTRNESSSNDNTHMLDYLLRSVFSQTLPYTIAS
jgi:hypothetical protein